MLPASLLSGMNAAGVFFPLLNGTARSTPACELVLRGLPVKHASSFCSTFVTIQDVTRKRTVTGETETFTTTVKAAPCTVTDPGNTITSTETASVPAPVVTTILVLPPASTTTTVTAPTPTSTDSVTETITTTSTVNTDTIETTTTTTTTTTYVPPNPVVGANAKVGVPASNKASSGKSLAGQIAEDQSLLGCLEKGVLWQLAPYDCPCISQACSIYVIPRTATTVVLETPRYTLTATSPPICITATAADVIVSTTETFTNPAETETSTYTPSEETVTETSTPDPTTITETYTDPDTITLFSTSTTSTSTTTVTDTATETVTARGMPCEPRFICGVNSAVLCDGTCYCFSGTNGGVCAPNFPCGTFRQCTLDSDCEDTDVCLFQTCCNPSGPGICRPYPSCMNAGAPSRLFRRRREGQEGSFNAVGSSVRGSS